MYVIKDKRDMLREYYSEHFRSVYRFPPDHPERNRLITAWKNQSASLLAAYKSVNFCHKRKSSAPSIPPVLEVKVEVTTFKEGSSKTVNSKIYERDPASRAEAIRIHGAICKICRFDFEAHYGERGKGFIEIHHRNPLHTFNGQAQRTNPAEDLIPVCPNCHRMIHRMKDSILTIEQMKELYKP